MQWVGVWLNLIDCHKSTHTYETLCIHMGTFMT
jgi:hypothetical protein